MKEQRRIEEAKGMRVLLNVLHGERRKPYTDLHGMPTEEAIEKINEGDIFSRWQTEQEDSLHLREDVEDLTDAPECHRTECYNSVEGKCIALGDNDFGRRECPFFVTFGQARESQKKCLKRLLDEGREDLIERYGDQLVMMGIIDLGDQGLEQMFRGLSIIEQDLAKKTEIAKEKRKDVDPDYDGSEDDAIWPWKENDEQHGVDRDRKGTNLDDSLESAEEELFGRR